MSHALHIGYEPITVDPARHFLRDAPGILDLDELVAGFGQAIAAELAVGHVCCVVGEDGRLYPAFGDTPALADRADDDGIEVIAVEAPDGTPLAVLIATVTPIERRRLSRLRVAANIYATLAVTLLEASDEAPAEGLTTIERQCLSLTLAGQSYLDIGETLDRSAPAVGVHVRRAMARLGTSSVAEAISIAASRGMISQQTVVGA